MFATRASRPRVGGAALLLLAAAGCAGLLRHEVRISRQELQGKVEQVFPVGRRQSLVMVRFDDPQVVLTPGSGRVGLALTVRVELPGGQLQGRMTADGGLAYVGEEGALQITDARVRDLEVDGLPAVAASALEAAAAVVAARYFEQITVYRFRAGDFQQALTRLVLKSVEVRDGEIVAVVGL